MDWNHPIMLIPFDSFNVFFFLTLMQSSSGMFLQENLMRLIFSWFIFSMFLNVSLEFSAQF